MSPHVLVLGGTTEARELAASLAARPGVRVTTSLAGRVSRPGALDGEVRVGGFGGVEGLAEWLRAERVDAVVDATHPFATGITENAARAAAATGVPAVVLRRPGWTPVPGDRWHPAASLAEAAALLPPLGRRVFLTTGRLGLAAFAREPELHYLVRSVEPPSRRFRATRTSCWRAVRSRWSPRRPSCATIASTSWSPRTAAARPPRPN